MAGEPTGGGGAGERGDARDGFFLRRALALAENGTGLASPNPRVGAVVVAGDQVVGMGWHEGRGTPHAEIVALEAAGARAAGATLYVTLEPCSHHGRTPPCADALLAAGVARIVVGTRDPNPVVDGRGLDRLRAAGVQVTEGILARECRRLVEAFARHVITGLPLVTLKLAASLDGRVAARDGSSRWISGEDSRLDVHRLRAASDAVLVGSGTAVADDPSLTVRLEGYRGRQPLRVVVDARGRTPPSAAVFDGRAPAVVATGPSVPPQARRAWEEAGAEVVVVDDLGDSEGVSLARLLEVLGKRDVQSVLIEGGPTLAAAALREHVVDRLVLYMAAKLLGADGVGVLAALGVASVEDALPLRIESVERVGADLKVTARPGEE